MTVTLYRGTKTLDLDLGAIAKLPESERATHVLEALATGGITAGKSLKGAETEHLTKVIGEWIAGGFSGMVSLTHALGLKASSRPKTSLLDVFKLGTETELRGLDVEKTGLKYSERLAGTKARSATETLDARGHVKPEDSKWPLFALTADQVHGDRGCVEIVFGPMDHADRAEIARRQTVLALAEGAITECAGQTVADVVALFNGRLSAAAVEDPELAKYALELGSDAKVHVDKSHFRSAQTNLEVPLKKIGLVGDESIPALFGGAPDDQAMFVEARAQAQKILDLLRPTAAAVHGGVHDPASIKLDKLAAILTLLVYDLAKQNQSGKGAWPVLPKVGAGDLIRECLSARDKVVLYAHASDPKRYEALEGALVEAAKATKAKKSFGKSLATGELEKIQAEVRRLVKPGRQPKRWGAEKTGYGKVDWSERAYAGTITGKPIPTTYNYVRKGLIQREPKLVLELRRMDNPVNSGFGGEASLAKIDAAAERPAPRPTKALR